MIILLKWYLNIYKSKYANVEIRILILIFKSLLIGLAM